MSALIFAYGSNVGLARLPSATRLLTAVRSRQRRARSRLGVNL